MTTFPATDLSIFSPWLDVNVHTYATTKEPRKKVSAKNSYNKNQEIGIQVTSIL